jgi:putative transcriptional regulator
MIRPLPKTVRVFNHTPRNPNDALSSTEELALSADVHDGILSAVTPLPVPVLAKARLLDRLKTLHRFPEECAARIAEQVELPLTRVNELLLAIDDPKSWGPGPGDGIELLHFDGGQRVRNAITGFVRVPAGSNFPRHRHVGTEIVLVLQGAFRDEDGALHSVGDEVELPGGTEHEFIVVSHIPLIKAVIVFDGIYFGSELISPRDPRA